MLTSQYGCMATSHTMLYDTSLPVRTKEMSSLQLIGSINQITIATTKIGATIINHKIIPHRDIKIFDIFQWIKFLYKYMTSEIICIHCFLILEKKSHVFTFFEDIVSFFCLRSIITLIYYEKRDSLQHFKSHETARINLLHR